MTGNRYIDAARQDFDKIKDEVERVRNNISDESESPRSGSSLIDTAWNDLQEHWRKLEASGESASKEAHNAFEEAKQRLQRVLDTHRKS